MLVKLHQIKAIIIYGIYKGQKFVKNTGGYDLSLYLLCFISILSRSHTIFLFKSSLKVGLTGIAKIIAYFGQTFFRKSKETFCLFQFAAADISAGVKS